MATAFSVFVNIGGKLNSSLGAAVKAAEAQVAGLGRRIAATNAKFAASLAAGGRKLQETGRAMSTSVSLPLALLGKAGFDAAYQFEKVGNAVQAVGDITDDQRSSLTRYVKELNAAFPYTNAEIMKSAEELSKAGFNFEQMRGSLRSTLNLGLAGDVPLKEAADIATNILTAMNLPRKTAEEAGASLTKVVDNLAYAANKSNTDVQKMGETYKYVGPMARAAGLDLNKVSAAAMIMANNGIKGAEAGVALRSALVRIVRPTKPMLAALERLNININDFVKGSRQISSSDIISSLSIDGIDASGAKKSIDRLLKDPKLAKSPGELIKRITQEVSSVLGSSSVIDKDKLSESVSSALTAAGSQVDLLGFLNALKAKGATLGDIARVFDSRQGARLMTLLFGDDFGALANQVEKESAGSADKMSAIRMKGIVGQVEQLNSSWENLWVTIGESGVLRDIGAVLDRITKALDDLAAKSPNLLRFGAHAAIAAIALGPLALLGGAALRVLAPLAKGLLALGSAATVGLATRLVAVAGGVKALAVAAALGAVGRLRAMAAGLIALGAVGGSRAVLSALAGGIVGLGRAVLMFPLVALRAVAVAMWGLVANPVGIAITAIVTALAALGVWVANNWEGIKTFFESFGRVFMASLGPSASGFVDGVVTKVKELWNWISRLLGPIDATGEKWHEWGGAAGRAVAAVVNAVVELPGKIAAAAGQFASAMGDLAQKGWNAVVNFDWAGLGRTIVQAIIDGVSSMGSALASKLSSMASDAWNGAKSKLGFGGGTTAAANGGAPAVAGARASGGPVSRGKTYLVGENGPELFRASSSGEIVANDKLQSLASADRVAEATTSGRSSRGDVSIVNHWTISGASDANEVARVAERKFREMIRRLEYEQRGLLSD